MCSSLLLTRPIYMFFISGDLKLLSGKKFTLVGTPEGHEIKDPNGECTSASP